MPEPPARPSPSASALEGNRLRWPWLRSLIAVLLSGSRARGVGAGAAGP